MQLTLHATRRTHHGASRLVIDCEPGPAKTRRAPSRLCRYARSMVIYDYGMQDYEFTPPILMMRNELQILPFLGPEVGTVWK